MLCCGTKATVFRWIHCRNRTKGFRFLCWPEGKLTWISPAQAAQGRPRPSHEAAEGGRRWVRGFFSLGCRYQQKRAWKRGLGQRARHGLSNSGDAILMFIHDFDHFEDLSDWLVTTHHSPLLHYLLFSPRRGPTDLPSQFPLFQLNFQFG